MASPEQMNEPRRRSRIPLVLMLLVIVLGLAACGGDDESSGDETATEQAATTGPGAETTVPDAADAQLADVVPEFSDAGLRVAVSYFSGDGEPGLVVRQTPAAGTVLQRGDLVDLDVSSGPNPPADLPVPDANGQTAAEGRATLERAGFEVIAIPVPAVTEDTVVFHSPAAGERAPRGSQVLLYTGG